MPAFPLAAPARVARPIRRPKGELPGPTGASEITPTETTDPAVMAIALVVFDWYPGASATRSYEPGSTPAIMNLPSAPARADELVPARYTVAPPSGPAADMTVPLTAPVGPENGTSCTEPASVAPSACTANPMIRTSA